jgi:hypothetical protein
VFIILVIGGGYLYYKKQTDRNRGKMGRKEIRLMKEIESYDVPTTDDPGDPDVSYKR